MKPSRNGDLNQPQGEGLPMGGKKCPLLGKSCIGGECAWWKPNHHMGEAGKPETGGCVVDQVEARLVQILQA